MTLELPSPQKGDGRGSFWGNVWRRDCVTSAAATLCQPSQFVCGNDFASNRPRVEASASPPLRIPPSPARSFQSRCEQHRCNRSTYNAWHTSSLLAWAILLHFLRNYDAHEQTATLHCVTWMASWATTRTADCPLRKPAEQLHRLKHGIYYCWRIAPDGPFPERGRTEYWLGSGRRPTSRNSKET